MREFLDPVNWSRKTRSKYKQHHSIGWDPELNKKEKRGWASGTIPVCLCFPDYTRWPASSYSWDHKISPPQQIVPSNYEPKDKGGWIIQPETENKNKPVLKMLWCSDTVTAKIRNTVPSLTTQIWSVASLLTVTLSAINWPTCRFKSLFYQLRLTVLFTESKRIFNTASLKCRLSCTFSVLIYFSSYWVLRVPLWHTCSLQYWGT